MKRHKGLTSICLSFSLAIFSGCGAGDTIDPAIDVDENVKLTLALVKSPSTADFIPLKVVSSKKEADHWLVTVVKQSDEKKRGRFRVDQANGKVTRLED